jgi:hypothetical protein
VDFDQVAALVRSGLNDSEIARLTSIPRSTVRDWRRGRVAVRTRPPRGGSRHLCPGDHDFGLLPAASYCYLLGMYLGDGCLSEHDRGVFKLRVVCDAAYPGIIAECRAAMEAILPANRSHVSERRGCVEVSMYSKHWICLFPQHATGRKHERRITLEPWQAIAVSQETELFLRGLIHSDGCRVVANDRGRESVRYHFSNRSEDIKMLLCEALDRLDIPWTRPSNRDIAVYRKTATARLDQFIGPKS